jgi:hypothetical protein
VVRCRWRDGEQLVDPYAGAPQHPQREVVPSAALVHRRNHLIDLLFLEVVGCSSRLPENVVIGNNGCDFERHLEFCTAAKLHSQILPFEANFLSLWHVGILSKVTK